MVQNGVAVPSVGKGCAHIVGSGTSLGVCSGGPPRCVSPKPPSAVAITGFFTRRLCRGSGTSGTRKSLRAVS